MITSFRDQIRELSPRWLKTGLAEKILYSIGLHWDAIGDFAVEGVKKRFPLLTNSADALQLAGRSRKMRRGPDEPEGNFTARILTWLDDHRTRGGPYALLRQLYGYFAADPPLSMALVYESGKRFVVDMATGAVTESVGAYWDTDTVHWARWWLLLGGGTVPPDGVWGDPGSWDDGGVWDYGLEGFDVANLRLIPHEWNAAHARGYITLISPGVELWDYPAGLWSDPGVWGATTDLVATISVD